ncbi:MAG: primosomal protein N', partial [Desulfobulbaceae bacterium]|nr:primosomal protein N' [Desulfobulbaceae bacterium]
YSITTAKTHDFEALYEKEIGLRQSLKFPPFSRLINLRMTGEREEDVREFAIRLASVAGRRAKKEGAVSVLGPAAAPLSRLRGKYRWQCLLMGKSVESLHSFCRALLQDQGVSGKTDRVKLIVDVDPENML